MKTPFHLILFKTFQAQRGLVRTRMAELDLSPGQPKILTALRMGGSQMQKDLAAACDIEPATISRLLPGMEAQGLITRKTMKDNRRAEWISITPEGEQAESAMKLRFDEIEQTALNTFTPEERQQFTHYLCRMYQNLTGREID